MKTERVETDGTRVIINADNEATARAIAAAADRERIKMEGSAAEKMDSFGDWLGEIVDGLNRPSMGMFGWALAAVACVMAYLSFSRLAPSIELEILFGIVGVVCVLALKESAARWAKASNIAAKSVGDFYFYVCVGLMVLIFAVGVAFQAAVSEDTESGLIGIEEKVSAKEREIRNAEYDAREMQRPVDTVDVLEQDIARVLARPARNASGQPAGFTVGEAVGAGPRDPDGLQPPAFCMPNRTRQTYIDRECPDLIDMEKDLRRRRQYDAAMAAIDVQRAELEDLRKTMPKRASGQALGERINPTESAFWGLVISAMLLLGVEIFMVFCVYVSKRHPKGVTVAMAAMNTAPQPGRV